MGAGREAGPEEFMFGLGPLAAQTRPYGKRSKSYQGLGGKSDKGNEIIVIYIT